MFTPWLRIAFVLTTFHAYAVGAFAAGTEKFYENASSSGALLNLIKNTKRSIDIEIYEMKDTSVHDALKAAQDRGVKIRIIQEPKPVGVSCSLFAAKQNEDDPTCLRNKQFVRDIRAKGGVYIPFASAQLCGERGSKCFQHGKMVISDGQYVFLSTGNFNPTSLCNKSQAETCNRDYSVLTWDAGSVRTFQTVFNNDLQGRTYDLGAILSSPDAQKVTVSPLSMKPLVEFIASAKQLVQIQNQYLKDAELNEAIVKAAQRGVKVYVNVASACSFSKPTGSSAVNWSKTFTMFDQAGILSRIFTRLIKISGLSGYLHAKAILVDSARAWVGSVNGSSSALSNNREFGIFIDDQAEALKLGAFMKNDYLEKNGETWQESLNCAKDPRPFDTMVEAD